MTDVRFRYSAVDSSGGSVRGEIGVPAQAGEPEVYRRLLARGLTPLDIAPARAATPVFSDRVTQADIANLTRELAALVEARIPLDRGIMSIAEHETRPRLRAMLSDVASRLSAGEALTQALAPYASTFGSVYIETLRAAEKSGNIVAVMVHLADILERQLESRQQVKRALMYPVIVLGVVSLAVAILVTFVIPRFGETFRGQGLKLPLVTRALIAIGESAKAYWFVYLGALAAAVFALSSTWRSPTGRLSLERFLLRIPYINRILTSTTTARFASVVSIGLASGLDIMESIVMGARSTGRPVFVQECDALASRLREGEPLSGVVESTSYLPRFAQRMLAAGKDSSELARACSLIARHFDREASHLTKNISTIIEPILTVVLAVIVLGVALSVFLPMWQMVRVRQ